MRKILFKALLNTVKKYIPEKEVICEKIRQNITTLNKSYHIRYAKVLLTKAKNEKELKCIWKTLMQKHHPDRGGDLEIAQEINKMYDILRQQL